MKLAYGHYHISQIGSYSDPPLFPDPGDTIEQGGIKYTVVKVDLTTGVIDLRGSDGKWYRSTLNSRSAPSQIRWYRDTF